MAQFRGTIASKSGEISRLGNKNDGIDVDVNAWDSGVFVRGFHDEVLGDLFRVEITGGSNGKHGRTMVGTLHERSDGTLGWTPTHGELEIIK